MKKSLMIIALLVTISLTTSIIIGSGCDPKPKVGDACSSNIDCQDICRLVCQNNQCASTGRDWEDKCRSANDIPPEDYCNPFSKSSCDAEPNCNWIPVCV